MTGTPNPVLVLLISNDHVHAHVLLLNYRGLRNVCNKTVKCQPKNVILRQYSLKFTAEDEFPDFDIG